jgi:hypothetical protein
VEQAHRAKIRDRREGGYSVCGAFVMARCEQASADARKLLERAGIVVARACRRRCGVAVGVASPTAGTTGLVVGANWNVDLMAEREVSAPPTGRRSSPCR